MPSTAQQDNRPPNRGPRRLIGRKLIASLATLLTIIGFSAGPAIASAKREAANAQLAGKKVLLIPYWLDNFGISFTHWMTVLLKAEGITATTINPNAVASAELNAISTGLREPPVRRHRLGAH